MGVFLSRCVLGCAPSYLRDLCCPSSAAFCCEGWVFGPSCPFGYYAAKGLFGCGSISMEWSPLWAAFFTNGPPSKFYISLKSFFLSVTGLGAPLSSSLLKRRYISLQNEWMKNVETTFIDCDMWKSRIMRIRKKGDRESWKWRVSFRKLLKALHKYSDAYVNTIRWRGRG